MMWWVNLISFATSLLTAFAVGYLISLLFRYLKRIVALLTRIATALEGQADFWDSAGMGQSLITELRDIRKLLEEKEQQSAL